MPDELFDARQPAAAADQSTLTAAPGLAQTHLTARPGDKFGRYKILEEIGQGGCGVVFIAEQEEPVRRRVALKVIKLGMDTRQVMARFEAERQALAMMDHPNIARVLDAGATDAGRPFFAMELVRGVKITDYCDQNKLTTKDRLELFIQVCQAVQHAHQKGIIHRDLKPSNILVTLQDGVPVPKVIDFGIAKATANQKLTDKTIYTALEQFIGTPAYMSPEQAEVSGLDIDTRSDIYSLGVLLYELLIGETPFSSEELLSVGLEAMRRTLREKEPTRPSTKLSTMMDADVTAIAQHRQSDPPRLIKLVRGDLDWIVMKCLEKDRTRRYETANGLAVDIQRHLSNEAVTARPQSRLYQLQKVVRRNRAVFTAAAAFASLLIVGILVSTSEALRATRAEREQSRLRQDAQTNEQKAKTEAVKSEQVAQFLKDMLNGVGPSVAQGSDTKLLSEILSKTAERVGRDLTNQPQVEIELRGTMGRVYNALSEYGEAEKMLSAAIRRCRTLSPGNEAQLAALLDDLGMVLWREGKEAGATNSITEAVALSRSSTDEQGRRALALRLNSLATVTSDYSLPTAETALREALDIQQKLLDKNDPATLTTMVNLAFLLDRQQKRAEAEPMLRKAVAAERTLPADQTPMLATALNLLGLFQINRDNVEADDLLRQALQIRRKLYPKDHADLAQSLSNLARVLKAKEDLEGAEKYLGEAVAMQRRLFPNGSREVARNQLDLGLLQQAEGKLTEAEASFRAASAVRRTVFGETNLATAVALEDLGSVLEAEQKLAEAEVVYRESIAIKRQLKLRGVAGIDTAAVRLAEQLLRRGRKSEAIALCDEELTAMDAAYGKQSLEAASWRGRMSNVLYHAGDSARAETLLMEALEKLRQEPHANDRGLDSALASLANLLTTRGKLAQAEAIRREELALERKLSGKEHPFVANSLADLGNLLVAEGKLNDAEAAYREALAIRRKSTGQADVSVSDSLNALGRVLEVQGKFEDAEAAYREELATRRKLLGKEHPTVADSLEGLGYVLEAQGKLGDAEAAYREELAIRRKLPPDEIELASSLAKLGHALLSQSKFAEAEPLIRECLDVREKQAPDDWLTFNARSMLGGALLGQKRFAEAEPLLLSGYEGIKQRRASLPAGSPRLREAIQRLGQFYEQTNRPEKAAECKKELAQLEKPEK
jgi:serine/threonine protein kinase